MFDRSELRSLGWFSSSVRWQMIVFLILALLSILAKVWLAGQGHNIDVESWRLLAETVLQGKSVYADTSRNNWGPIWCYICAGARYAQAHLLGSDSLEDFHRLIALVLSLADVAIAFLLARHQSYVAGALFLVNPVSLLVTGFHSQFENVAVLLGLAGCLLLDDEDETHPLRPLRFGLAMLILGLSLVVKHVLIFLPFWFVFRPRASRRRRLFSLLPLGVFAVSFLPFVRDERALEGVLEHVLMYDSEHLDGFFPYLFHAVIPLNAVEALFSWVPVFSGFQFVWLVAMMMTGFAVREKGPKEQLFVYLVAMVVFSSAIANQYLVIPLATCAVYWRHLSVWWYVAVTALYLSASPVNIGMLPAMAPYAETVIELGLDKWHGITALFVFLLLYLVAAGRIATRDSGNIRWP